VGTAWRWRVIQEYVFGDKLVDVTLGYRYQLLDAIAPVHMVGETRVIGFSKQCCDGHGVDSVCPFSTSTLQPMQFQVHLLAVVVAPLVLTSIVLHLSITCRIQLWTLLNVRAGYVNCST